MWRGRPWLLAEEILFHPSSPVTSELDEDEDDDDEEGEVDSKNNNEEVDPTKANNENQSDLAVEGDGIPSSRNDPAIKTLTKVLGCTSSAIRGALPVRSQLSFLFCSANCLHLPQDQVSLL